MELGQSLLQSGSRDRAACAGARPTRTASASGSEEEATDWEALLISQHRAGKKYKYRERYETERIGECCVTCC